MEYKDLNELNEKLKIFAGFYCSNSRTKIWSDSKGNEYGYWDYVGINLVNDANAQIKYIYPELAKRKVRIEFTKDYNIEWRQHPYYWTIYNETSLVSVGEDFNNFTLAFAFAVEKYIDYLEENNGR